MDELIFITVILVSDFSAGAVTVSFSEGESSKIFTTEIPDDDIAEGSEFFVALIGGPVLGEDCAQLLRIVDNDSNF